MQLVRKADNDAACAISGPSIKVASMQLAFGFGPIDAQRIEFRDLMQETLLWRNRDDHASVGQQDWLAELQGPIPPRPPLALESCNGKIRPLEKAEQRLGIAGVRARRRLANHAHGGPSLHVQRRHAPRIQFDEAVLHLYRAPLILCGVP